ncbi:MAG: hypothetical protein K2X93_01575 [Candidatus Obscuribacterales bacterium]|nr:hypothetical protein [Candidatus Obscuribacterales bacterium]
MPLFLNWLDYLIPLTYCLQIQRGIILQGAGLNDLWYWINQLAILGFFLIYLTERKKVKFSVDEDLPTGQMAGYWLLDRTASFSRWLDHALLH